METDDDSLENLIAVIQDRIERQGGIATFRLTELRDIGEFGRLGHRIRDQIQKALTDNDVGYYPDPLPTTADKVLNVRFFDRLSKVAPLIDAATVVSAENDKILIKFANAKSVVANLSAERDAISKIRRILDRLK